MSFCFIDDFIMIRLRLNSTTYTHMISVLDNVLNTTALNQIHWHKGRALYKIIVDNGFSQTIKKISISGTTIDITISDPIGHSDLMENDDAFEYPSTYHSESESMTGAQFEFKNGKLILTKLLLAG